MEITPELLRKHKDYLLEVTVKSHRRTSKKGKVYNVKQFERDVKKMSTAQLNAEIDNEGPMMRAARVELSNRTDKIQRDRVEQRVPLAPLAKPYGKKKPKTWNQYGTRPKGGWPKQGKSDFEKGFTRVPRHKVGKSW